MRLPKIECFIICKIWLFTLEEVLHLLFIIQDFGGDFAVLKDLGWKLFSDLNPIPGFRRPASLRIRGYLKYLINYIF